MRSTGSHKEQGRDRDRYGTIIVNLVLILFYFHYQRAYLSARVHHFFNVDYTAECIYSLTTCRFCEMYNRACKVEERRERFFRQASSFIPSAAVIISVKTARRCNFLSSGATTTVISLQIRLFASVPVAALREESPRDPASVTYTCVGSCCSRGIVCKHDEASSGCAGENR